VELVNIEEWRHDHSAANAPGLPAASHTLSSTRITPPDRMVPTFERADHHRVRPADPHLPLVFMLVLTQLSAGAFLFLSLLPDLQRQAGLAALLVALISLAASTLHLGRPAFAWRALKMWKRSWLSREVLCFSLFAVAAAISAVLPLAPYAAAVLGVAGITASAFIYLVPARPAWNSMRTVADFHLTALLLGPLFLASLGIHVPMLAVVVASAVQLLNQVVKVLVLAASDEFELRAAARLLTNDLRTILLVRIILLIAGGIVLPLVGRPVWALSLALAGEMVSRYLFFVGVVPKNVADGFMARRAA
jgi:DMSO reductase anchor subunit